MHFYRVAFVAPDWLDSGLTPGDPGHPLYVHAPAQGQGRFDLPALFVALYLARQPHAAVGEALGNFSTWTTAEITRTRDDRGRTLQRSLISLETDRRFIDLDDGATLDRLGWRPSDVVNRDRSKTQQLAQLQWLDRQRHDTGGFLWWSYWSPAWTVAMAWADANLPPNYPDMKILEIEPLTPDSPAVRTAAAVLARPLGVPRATRLAGVHVEPEVGNAK